MAGIMQRWQGAVLAKLLFALTGGIKQDGASAAFVYVTGAAPTNGTNGTLAGIAQPGSLLIRTDSPALYQNSNTKASPTWSSAPMTGAAGITSGTIAGVTIDNSVIGGSTPAAGTFTTLGSTGLQTKSVTASITAHSGGGQASATALTTDINQVRTVAANADSVKLPPAKAGLAVYVFNDDATHDAAVFPDTGDAIDNGSADASVTLSHTKRAAFFCVVDGQWASAQLGAVSA